MVGFHRVLISTAIVFSLGFAVWSGWTFSQSGEFWAGAAAIGFGVSILFLISYLYYHSQAGTTRFAAQGWVRSLYFVILGSHTILAMVIVPLVIATLVFALRENFVRHRRLARIALPIWLYVSVTGILVYLMLYRWFPPPSL